MAGATPGTPSRAYGRLATAAFFLAVTICTALLLPRLQIGPATSRAVKLSNLAYVSHGTDRQRLDLYCPMSDSPVPIIVWVHGGAWEGGSRENPPVLDLLQDGYAIAAIDYRLSGDATFPAQLEDCKAAIRWLRAKAATYRLDPGTVIGIGSSAGGHLVALLASTGHVRDFDVGENLGESSELSAAVDFFGPTDLVELRGGALDQAVLKLLGGSVVANLATARAASPVAWATRDSAPTLIIHGSDDRLVPVDQSLRLFRALETAGAKVAYQPVPGGHDGATILRALPRVRRFLADLARERQQ